MAETTMDQIKRVEVRWEPLTGGTAKAQWL
jgi:hypothetical protein